MQTLMQIDNLESARVLLNPMRIEILDILRDRGTCTEIAKELSTSAQRANNHVKELLRVGLVDIVETRPKRNMIESVYQASAKSYWLSPRLTQRMGDDATPLRDRMSLHNLISMSERLQHDAAALLNEVDESEVPSFGLTAEVTLRTEADRQAFAKDYLKVMHLLIEKYQGRGKKKHSYTAMVICYPAVEQDAAGDRG